MTLIIGAAGRARHGKTDFCETIRDHVIYEQGGRAALYDIGDLIRRYCISEGLLPIVERKDMTRSQLEILINVGKEKRAVNLDFWIGQMIHQIRLDNLDVALIPNIRYENEAEAIHTAGGHIVRLQRRNKDGSIYISEDRPPNDISETNLEFWPADAYLTTVEGQVDLIKMQALTFYEYFASRF